MKLLDLTLPTPAENLALDEAILESAESAVEHDEIIRLWEPAEHFVVLGRSSPHAKEVNHEFCSSHRLPVYRRASGGATIVTGPGCLMYAVLLDYRTRPELRMLDTAHQFVMSQMQSALGRMGIDADMRGTSDLTLGNLKVSGNSLRCKRNWMLYHGTFLCDFDLKYISNCLRMPVRQPDYRRGRDHQRFLTCLPSTTDRLKPAIINQWQPDGQWEYCLEERVRDLVENKYLMKNWNEKV